MSFEPNVQDICAITVFRQFAAELERHCIGVYLSDRTSLNALHSVLAQANQGIQEVKMQLTAGCSIDAHCPPLHVCNGGECEVIFSPLQTPPQRRPEPPKPK